MAMDSVTVMEPAMATAMLDLTPHLLTHCFLSTLMTMLILMTTPTVKAD